MSLFEDHCSVSHVVDEAFFKLFDEGFVGVVGLAYLFVVVAGFRVVCEAFVVECAEEVGVYGESLVISGDCFVVVFHLVVNYTFGQK